MNDTPRRKWYQRFYDRRQKIGVGLFWLGPLAMVVFALIAMFATPLGDGLELEPRTQEEVAVNTTEDQPGAEARPGSNADEASDTSSGAEAEEATDEPEPSDSDSEKSRKER